MHRLSVDADALVNITGVSRNQNDIFMINCQSAFISHQNVYDVKLWTFLSSDHEAGRRREDDIG